MSATLATYDQDLVRWGLHLLEGGGRLFEPETNNNSVNGYTYPSETPEPQLMNIPPTAVHNHIANDEAIAHVLQEELSKLDAEEASAGDTAQSVDDASKAVILSQDWQDHPAFNSTSEDTTYSAGTPESEGLAYGAAAGYQQTGLTSDVQSLGGEDEDTMGPRKQTSGSGSHSKTSGSGSRGRAKESTPDYDSYQYGDDDENLTLALALSEDEHRYDEEVAKRLTKLDSIRHIPRINADVMPTVDVATSDHDRLLERLLMYGLNERQIQGDGNCQFRALSDQLYRTPDHHKFVRKAVVSQLKAQPDVYSGYVPMAYGEYLKKMAKSGEWGDHVTLQSAADSYGVKIWLITSFKDTSFIEILPVKLLSNRGWRSKPSLD